MTFATDALQTDFKTNCLPANHQQILIFVINMDRSPERMAVISSELDYLGLAFSRFAAVDGEQLSPSIKAAYPGLNIGQIGCMLSHFGLWERMVREEIPQAVILEDDAAVAKGLVEICTSTEWLAARRDLVRLETAAFRPITVSAKGKPISARRKFHAIHSICHGSAGYLLSLNGARKLLEMPRRNDLPLDMFLWDRQTVAELDAVATIPAPIRQRSYHLEEAYGIFASTISEIDIHILAKQRAARTPRNLARWMRMKTRHLLRIFGLPYPFNIPFG